MKEYLKQIINIDEEHDGFSFTPMEKDFSVTEIRGFTYKNRGEPVKGNSMGEKYHVILYRESQEEGVTHQDCFTPILGDPLQYAAGLIESGWFGVISKKTTTSESFITPIFTAVSNSTTLTQEEVEKLAELS